jgi:hypothetical protein
MKISLGICSNYGCLKSSVTFSRLKWSERSEQVTEYEYAYIILEVSVSLSLSVYARARAYICVCMCIYI